ncbi:Gfo/Idh/MocA family oxidoreductase [Brachybacterium sp. JHP9]|uniref:Gfo/Idh/MocA family oxidoreductase n=1 Tax=Brachybacterium equifaecis TaxID=2910770 RepID=A0ABT0R074_9MICO|nr:Gfo/Idh/MocA family oxidoreductase [Brachybacterium equifaecis]MCL6423159.1 Gfo/Idh/MocA family oxidoreductase [Brachybacterium equifaecis]
MRLAVLGSGMIVRDFLPHAREVEGLELAAIFGRPASREKLEAIAGEHGIARVHTDLAACLADPGVDTVWVALTNDLHFEASIAALEAGKHVICEKPFVLREDHLAQLRAIAEERELILVEAITTLDLPAFEWVRTHLDLVGDVRLLQCDYSQRSSRLDAFARGETPAAFDPARGGGALLDIGIYTLHLAVGLLGVPRRVRYTPRIERGADTSGVLVLDYGDSTAVCVCAKDSYGPRRTAVQGTDGWIAVDGPPNTMGPVRVQRRGEAEESAPEQPAEHRMVPEFRAFARMIAAGDLAERDRRLDHSQAVLRLALETLRGAGLGPAAAAPSAGAESPPLRAGTA